MSILKLGPIRRSIGAVLIGTLTLSGCVQWQPHTAPDQALHGQRYDVVIVHPREGPDMYVMDPRITADSLQGVERIVSRSFDRVLGYVERPVSIPLSAIRTVETPSTTYMPLLVVTVMAVVLFATMLASADWEYLSSTPP